MIAQELFQIWHHIIGALEQHLWYIVDDNEAFLPSLRVAISLNERQYDELLQRSAIKFKRGGLFGISTDQLDYLRMQGQFNLKCTKSKFIASKSRVFIYIGDPWSKSPKLQKASNRGPLLRPRIRQLPAPDIAIIDRLCHERNADEEPELIVDEQLPPPPQIEERNQQENVPPQGEEAQQPRPARRRRVLQELQLQPVLERRTRRRADETQQEEANQIRLHRRAVAQEEHQLHPPPERRIRPRGKDNALQGTIIDCAGFFESNRGETSLQDGSFGRTFLFGSGAA
jgi:hypothetical protein